LEEKPDIPEITKEQLDQLRDLGVHDDEMEGMSEEEADALIAELIEERRKGRGVGRR